MANNDKYQTTGHLGGKCTGNHWIPFKRASYVENVSISGRHDIYEFLRGGVHLALCTILIVLVHHRLQRVDDIEVCSVIGVAAQTHWAHTLKIKIF